MTQLDKTTTRVERDNSHASDPIEAVYQLGRRYNITQMARLMSCKRPSTLINKFNPACEGHHLTLSEAIAVTEFTNDNAIISAWALSRGQMLVDMPAGAVSDEDLVEQVLLAQSIFGQLMQVIHDARRDGVIDRLEQAQIERVGRESAQHVLGLICSTGANVRELNAGRG
ncbi:phage regulatory CII family protein [Pseudaeromonas pectinilytica]